MNNLMLTMATEADFERYHELRHTMTVEDAIQAMLEEKEYQQEYNRQMDIVNSI